jgi:hypothetical protein
MLSIVCSFLLLTTPAVQPVQEEQVQSAAQEEATLTQEDLLVLEDEVALLETNEEAEGLAQ